MWKISLYVLLFIGLVSKANSIQKRSIDLIAAHSLISDSKLPRDIVPNSYNLTLVIAPEKTDKFVGSVIINATVQHKTRTFYLHVHPDLTIGSLNVSEILSPYFDDNTPPGKEQLLSATWEQVQKQSMMEIDMHTEIEPGALLLLNITYQGVMLNYTSEGLFRSSYVDPETKETKWYAATFLRPNLARNVFPCFDEPAYKVPFSLKVVRPTQMSAVSNMPTEYSSEKDEESTTDLFLPTPPMSTFAIAVVVSELSHVCHTVNDSESKLNMICKHDGMSVFSFAL